LKDVFAPTRDVILPNTNGKRLVRTRTLCELSEKVAMSTSGGKRKNGSLPRIRNVKSILVEKNVKSNILKHDLIMAIQIDHSHRTEAGGYLKDEARLTSVSSEAR
jgi:hypothetical protein